MTMTSGQEQVKAADHMQPVLALTADQAMKNMQVRINAISGD
jgi:hypothetical protein